MQTALPPQTTITRGRKFDQVRDGAAVIFLRDGFAAASVDDIARAARVSKATLYSYFPDKTLMFREVLRASLDSAFREPPFDPAHPGPLPLALPQVLADLGRWLVSELRLRLHRVITAEAHRFPEDADAYHHALSDRVVAPLARLIEDWIATGQARAHDAARSAQQMVALVAGQLQQRALLTGAGPDEEQITRTAADAATLFLLAHGTG